MNAQHTPGEWRIGDAGYTIFGPPDGNPSPETIAVLKGPNWRGNGKLIAQASVLLRQRDEVIEMCEDALRMAEELRRSTGDATPAAICHVLRAAIARAKEGQ